MQKWEERIYDRLEGELKGRKNLNQLIQALIRDDRLEDLTQSTTDPEFQEKLMQEYHISV